MEEIPLFSDKNKIGSKSNHGKLMGRLQENNEEREGKFAQGF